MDKLAWNTKEDDAKTILQADGLHDDDARLP
jgi:hypothetical protein